MWAPTVILWICFIDGMKTIKMGIKKSDIKPGDLVMFQQIRGQNSSDLQRRATALHMELARVINPPFNANRTRVNIEKVFDPSINVGVKPKHIIFAQSMFDEGDSVLTSSPAQSLKLEIFKIPENQTASESMRRQIQLANRSGYYWTVFLSHIPSIFGEFQSALQSTIISHWYLFSDPRWTECPASPQYLIRFLGQILNPSHLDNNTLDDFRELVANYVFSWYLNQDSESRVPRDFEEYLNLVESHLKREQHGYHPKSMNILRLFYRYLQRHKPRVCPKLEILKKDYVNWNMVNDMLLFIRLQQNMEENTATLIQLPNLYKSFGSDANSTQRAWDKPPNHRVGSWEMMWPIADLVSHKIGSRILNEESNEEALVDVKHSRMKIIRIWINLLRADVFHKYWKTLSDLKNTGSSGRIAIANLDWILTDPWIESLYGIFGRNNTSVDLIGEL